MNTPLWRLILRRLSRPIGAICAALLFVAPMTTQRISAEAPPSPSIEDKPAETPAEAAPDQPTLNVPAPTTEPQPDPSTDPNQILEEALAAMETAALELEGDGPSPLAVSKQELAVQLLQKLLSAPQSSPSSSPQSAASPQSSSPDKEPEPSSAESNSAPNGSGGRRADDENSQESSENVAGPTEAGSTTLAPKARANSVWGHLPPRQQESLLRSLSDSFLPEYESQIKRYYEALAEGKDHKKEP